MVCIACLPICGSAEVELLLEGTGEEPGVRLGERAEMEPDECRVDLNSNA